MGVNTVSVRASSWGSLFDCAYKWEGVHLHGIRKASGPRALMGTAIHAGTAAFDLSRINHTGLSANDAAGALVDVLKSPSFDVDWASDDLTPREVEAIALTLHTRYCLDWSPTFEFCSVEMETKPFPIDCGNGMTIELTGTLDRCRIRKEISGKGICDLKSGGAAVANGKAKTKGHVAQIGTYELLYEYTTGEVVTAPAEIIGLKTRGKPEIATGEIRNARALMVGTDDYKGLIEFGAEMFRSGLFPPNPQSMTCDERYCPRWSICRYHD